MNDKTLDRLVPYIAKAVVPTDLVGEERSYYEELERLGQAFDETCESPETREVVGHVIEIIRDLAWAIDEATGSGEHSRWLIEHGNFRTWSVAE